MRFKRKCECGSKSVARIVYGFPSEKMFEDTKNGKYVLGGCVLWEGRPNWECNSCGKVWV